jgi:hypothetical protein
VHLVGSYIHIISPYNTIRGFAVVVTQRAKEKYRLYG